MDIVNSFVIESERFYFYDISKVIEEHKKLKKLPIVLKILLEANLRNVKDNIEFEKIVNIFSNRMDSKINFSPARIVLEEDYGISILADLASLRDINSDINPKVIIDLLLKPKYDEVNKEKNSFYKWIVNSFSNFRLGFKDKDNFKDINLECLSTILHIEKKDEDYYLYPETVLGKNSFGVFGFQANDIELKMASFGETLSIDLPKVVGVNIKDDLIEDSLFSFSIFKALEEKLKEHNLENKILEFHGKGLKYLSLEERVTLLNMASTFKATSFYFAIDDETIDYFNTTRENEDFTHLIKKYLELQGMFYSEDEELEYDELLEFEVSSLESMEKEQESSSFSSYKEISESIFKEDESWQNLEFEDSNKYTWNENSILLQPLNIYTEQNLEKIEIKSASILALLEDSISTTEISSLEQISLYSPTAKYLESKGIKSYEYGTFKDRVMNPQIMIRGLFDSKDIHNQMVSKEGGYTIDYETSEILPIFKKAYRFEQEKKDFVIFAGENYGFGKSIDWAAKGMKVLGIKAIIAKSFGEEHRLDLIKYGVLPLEFIDDDIDSLKLKGKEFISILTEEIKPDSKIDAVIQKDDINIQIELKCRLDTQKEVDYYSNGGVIPYILKKAFVYHNC